MGRGATIATIITVPLFGLGLIYASSGGTLQLAGWSFPLWMAVLAFAIQWLIWIPCSILRTERVYDLTGSLTFITLTVCALWFAHGEVGLDLRRIVVGAMVTLWAGRLGSYLFGRILADGHDSRFDDLKTDALKFLIPWTLQGLWVAVTLLPVLLIITQPQSSDGVGALDWVGWSLWLFGFTIEVIADRQKTRFRADPKNQGRWIDEGLWRYSQHPNYFGEILLWTGLFISGLGIFSGLELLSIASPLLTYLLLTRISGIPMLDEKAMSRWGDDPDYRAYRAATSTLMLGPRRESPPRS